MTEIVIIGAGGHDDDRRPIATSNSRQHGNATSARIVGMTADVMTTLRAFYAAEAAYLTEGAGFGEMARHLASDVVMYQASSLPYGGEWHGHDGFRQFIAAMGDSWDGLWFDDQQFLSDGDRVVVHSRGRLRARRTGRELKTSLLQWISFRDSLITEFRPYYHDTLAVLAVLDEQV